MKVFRFKIADYRKISQSFFIMMLVMIPVLMLSFFLLTYKSSFTFIIFGILFIFIICIIYILLLRHFLIYDSEILINNDGITERNLKLNTIFNFSWDEVESFKFNEAKHTNEDKDYIKITFKNSNHTIVTSEFKKNKVKYEYFIKFKNEVEKFVNANNL